MRYRADIDGLRAVAVVPVVLFHAAAPAFEGGYLGVDVFFVISGFLITRILLDDILQGRFSIIAFYARRIRRIVPALAAMLTCACVFAWLVLLPNSLREFGKSLLATAAFVSNILFYNQTGYFEPAASGTLLIHTWSLAVEEQFYITFPIVLFFLRKQGRVGLAGSLASLAALSFLLDVWRLHATASEAFYMPYTRFWELLLGSLLALDIVKPIEDRTIMQLIGLAGFGAILSGMADGEGWTRFLPPFGAALVIYSCTYDGSLIRRFLCLPPLVWIGLISYSLYLWHWPMIVFTEYFIFRPPTPQEMAAVVFAAVLVSTLSWRLVEQPLRRATLSKPQVLGGGLATLGAIAAVGVGIIASDGAKWRMPGAPRLEVAEARSSYGLRTCLLDTDQIWSEWKADGCFLVGRTPSNILLWGDSFAAHYAHGLAKYGSPSIGILQYTTNGCPPAIGYSREIIPNCKANNDYALKIIQKYDIHEVILSARWAAYENGDELAGRIGATITALLRAGIRVLVVGQSADFNFQFDDAERAAYLAWTDPRANWRAVERGDIDLSVNDDLERMSQEGAFFDPLAFICRDFMCPVLLDGQPLVIDHGHLTIFGSDTLGRPLAEIAVRNFGE